MGVDIFTEKALALPLENYVVTCSKTKKARKGIAADLLDLEICTKEQHDEMLEDKSFVVSFVLGWVEPLMSEEGYFEDHEPTLQEILEVLGRHNDIDFKEVVGEYSIRSFSNSRYSGYDVEVDVIYIMIESYDLFMTVPTPRGEEIGRKLKIKHVQETEWTTYSY
jgi:hypothetical protein